MPPEGYYYGYDLGSVNGDMTCEVIFYNGRLWALYPDSKFILMPKGLYCIVDKEDFDFLNQWRWQLSEGRAVRTYIDKKTRRMRTMMMHRIIMSMIDPKIQIDHINRNTLDNRKENLRMCTQQQNMGNTPLNKKAKIRFKGVSTRASLWTGTKKYRARIKDNGKEICIGYFTTPEDAAEAYDKRAIEIFGEFALTNKKMGLL